MYWDLHQMAAFNHLQATIGHVRGVDCHQDGQVLDVFHVRVGRAIKMRCKPPGPRKLVVN
jgi:hypothetical protein